MKTGSRTFGESQIDTESVVLYTGKEKTLIYLDNAATTQTLPQVLNVGKAVEYVYWNAGTMYQGGQRAHDVIEDARERIAKHIGVEKEQAKCSVFFTSGATEGNNWCIRGAVEAWWQRAEKGILRSETVRCPRIVTDSGEHHSVLNTVKAMEERRWCHAVYLPLNPITGAVDAKRVLESVNEDTVLVSVMMINNETGVRNPVEEIGEGLKGRHVLYHVDATQAVGKMEVDVKKIGCHMLTASGHKFHAGKGRGFVYIDPWENVVNLMEGGNQQMGRRPGTEDTTGAACLADALDYELENCNDGRLAYLTTRMSIGLSAIDGVHFNGKSNAWSGIKSVWFDGVNSEELLALLWKRNVYCSAGSACTTGEPEPSHVLKAMDAPEGALRGTIRISIGALNTLSEVEKACEEIRTCVELLRA